jgi:hypothetical protein
MIPLIGWMLGFYMIYRAIELTIRQTQGWRIIAMAILSTIFACLIGLCMWSLYSGSKDTTQATIKPTVGSDKWINERAAVGKKCMQQWRTIHPEDAGLPDDNEDSPRYHFMTNCMAQ